MKNHENKDVRILFLINSLGDGGAEKVFMEEASELTRQGYKVWLGVLRKGRRTPPPAVPYICFNFSNQYSLKGYWRLWKHIKTHNIEHLYVTLDKASVIARLTSLFLNISVSVRESGVYSRKSLKIKIFDLLLNWRVRAVVAVSKGVAQGIASRQFLYRKKIFVIENGIVPPKKSCDMYVNNRAFRDKNLVQVIAVGRLTEEKNHIMLFHAFSSVVQNISIDVHLTVIGKGLLYEKLNLELEKLNIKNRVSIVDSISSFKDIEVIYEKADIFVHSSIAEGFPNAILEAMSYALPVLTTAVPGAVDAIEHEVSGLIVEVGDVESLSKELERLILDQTLRRRLGVAACERVRNQFSFDRHMMRLIEVLGISVPKT